MSGKETPARILHALAGHPVFDGADEATGRCWLCGEEMARGLPCSKWQGANFTDQNKCRWPGATHVCEACAWACSWVAPPGFYGPHNPRPTKADGTPKKGVNLRLFSHLYDAGEYQALNKADKPAILTWLRAPKTGPWWATVADTGQKHMVPWAEVNARGGYGGVVLFEESPVMLPASPEGWALVDDVVDLLTWGVTKDELLTGRYSTRSWMTCPGALRAFDAAHGRLRHGPWFELTVWLGQRDEDEHKRRKKRGKDDREASRAAAREDGRRPARPPRGVPGRRRERAEALDADGGPASRRDADQRDGEGVGERAEAGASDLGHEQLSLALDDGARR